MVVSNVYPDDNRGSAALTAAAIDAARRAFPACTIALVAVRREHIEDAYRHTRASFPDVEILPPPIPVSGRPLSGILAMLRSFALLLRRPRRPSVTVGRILESDLLISRGGVLFLDRGTGRSTLSLWLTALPIVLANRFTIPTILYGTTIGPYRSTWGRLVSRWILRRSTLVMPRDPRSRREGQSLGIHQSRLVEMTDTVFGLTPPTRIQVAEVTERLRLTRCRFGALTVRSATAPPGRHAAFERMLRRSILNLLDQGVAERIVVVLQVDGLVDSDAAASRRFVDLAADERVELIDEDLSPSELMALYGAARFTIGCRLHSVIFSMIAGTPAFAVSMEGKKSEGVMESLGFPQFVVPYPELDYPSLVAVVAGTVSAGEELRTKIRVAVDAARERVSFAQQVIQGEIAT